MSAVRCTITRAVVRPFGAQSAPATGRRQHAASGRAPTLRHRDSLIARAEAPPQPHYGNAKRDEELMVKVSGKWSEGDKDKLMHAFAFAGDPTGVEIESNGEALVEFGTLDEKTEALRADGNEIEGTKVTVTSLK